MPTVQVLPGEGTTLSFAPITYSGGVPTVGTYGKVSNRTTIAGPDIGVNSVEKTTLDSTFHEYRPSQLPEPGEASLTIYFDPVAHSALLAMVLPQTTQGANVVSWKLEFAPPVGSSTSAGSLTATGFINKFAVKGMEIDNNLSADITIKFTGPVVPS